MKLWILHRQSGRSTKLGDPWLNPYGCVYSLVIRAKDEASARKAASGQCGDEGSGPWMDERFTSCDELKPSGRPGVLCRDKLEE